MATIKSYTDLEQSKKLAEILPLESADMFHFIHEVDTVGFGYKKDAEEFYSKTEFEYIPCWSLAALLGVLPKGTRLLKSTNISSVNDTKYHCDCPKGNIDKWFDNPIDACYKMIIELHEKNLL